LVVWDWDFGCNLVVWVKSKIEIKITRKDSARCLCRTKFTRTRPLTMSAMTSLAGKPLAVRPRAAGPHSSSRARSLRCTASATSDAAAAARSSAFPFVKIVGQEELKLALILNVIVGALPRVQSVGWEE
jgi:hypothetical protein